ncbi:DNA-binding protein [Listeria newyorkensis]|uniref:DNA-binding protein n=1 Tax=Listeria newyorkensis TaxID=1497681 RepID=A0A841Z163_9LIST|nr:DNA-binding protein [Listeria newyorkensis]MBC1459328.1 DNA-binding protein [Listeria newyorkensis]
MPKLFKMKAVAKELQVILEYAYKLVNSGLLPSLKLPTSKVREEALTEFKAKYEGYDLSNLEEIKAIELGSIGVEDDD